MQTYVVRVVLLQQPVPALVDVLVATRAAAHTQGGIHVHVVAGQVERNQQLEHDAPPGESLCQEDEQAGCCAPVRDHVQDGAKLGALFVLAGCVAIERIEKTGYAVEEGACARVQRHVIERCQGEENARVAYPSVSRRAEVVWQQAPYRSSLG